jgi:hypothetical protein
MTIERINTLIEASHIWFNNQEMGRGCCWMGIRSIDENSVVVSYCHCDDPYDVEVSIADLDQILLDNVTF